MPKKALKFYISKLEGLGSGLVAHFELVTFVLIIAALSFGLLILWFFALHPSASAPVPVVQTGLSMPQAELDEILRTIAERDKQYSAPPSLEEIPDVFRQR